jgi:hypothetical protein
MKLSKKAAPSSALRGIVPIYIWQARLCVSKAPPERRRQA